MRQPTTAKLLERLLKTNPDSTNCYFNSLLTYCFRNYDFVSMKILHLKMNYNDFFENPTSNTMDSIVEKMEASAYFPSKCLWYTKPFTKFLSVFMALPTKSPIFMFLDVESYMFDASTANQKKLGKDSTMFAHSIAFILIWNPEINQYEAKVMNPHGNYQCTKEMQFYEIPLSRRRTKKIYYDNTGGYNLFVLNEFVSAINRNSQIPAKIHYKTDAYHNYLGVNLQDFDAFGICYVFSFLLCEYLIRQPDTSRLTSETFPNWEVIQRHIFDLESDADIKNKHQHQIRYWILLTLDILGIGEGEGNTELL